MDCDWKFNWQSELSYINTQEGKELLTRRDVHILHCRSTDRVRSNVGPWWGTNQYRVLKPAPQKYTWNHHVWCQYWSKSPLTRRKETIYEDWFWWSDATPTLYLGKKRRWLSLRTPQTMKQRNYRSATQQWCMKIPTQDIMLFSLFGMHYMYLRWKIIWYLLSLCERRAFRLKTHQRFTLVNQMKTNMRSSFLKPSFVSHSNSGASSHTFWVECQRLKSCMERKTSTC